MSNDIINHVASTLSSLLRKHKASVHMHHAWEGLFNSAHPSCSYCDGYLPVM